ncbi:MAG: hypothetical protein ABIN58_12555 [candidate division WOR-3 bacterium]
MNAERPEIKGFSIVLLGDFNPKIFQPAWFSAQGLIREKEYETADIRVVHNEIVDFGLGWCHIQVTRDRFVAQGDQEPYEALRDLVLGAFKLLSHTPVTKMGINTEAHFRVESEKAWHAFGHLLTPKEIWNEIMSSPGMRSITLEEGQRRDGRKGYIRVTVEPSVRVIPGVFFRVNDHYEASKNLPGCSEMTSILEEAWTASRERSEEMILSLVRRI